MMKTIWKFEFRITDEFTIEMPKGAKILKVEAQYDIPCIWALVDSTLDKEPRAFHLYGTGHPIADYVKIENYIGTFQMVEGVLIWHVFEVTNG